VQRRGPIDLARERERLSELAELLPRTGVTAWLPTIVSGPAEVRCRALASFRAGTPPGAGGDRPAAASLVHREGPFLAPERGAPIPPSTCGPPTRR